MASLTGTKIKDTYDALLKVSDNGALDGTLQTITDGLGNNSALSLSTAGASVGGTLAVSGASTFTGNVGIGITPDGNAVLDVAKNDLVNGSTLRITNTNNGSSWAAGTPIGNLDFYTTDPSGAGVKGFVRCVQETVATTYPSGTYLSFGTRSTADPDSAERMKIYSGGDVSFRDTSANEAFYWDASAASLGIGTSSPASLLHLKGSTSKITLEDSDVAGATCIIQGGGAGNLTISADPDNAVASSYITLQVDGSERMRIDSSGVVQVRNDSAVFQLYNTDTSVATDQELGSIDFYTSDISAARVSSYVKSTFNSAFGDSYLTFGTSTGVSAATERMRILSSGGLTFNGDTSTANALDDYEEGTFTAVFTTTGTDFTSGGNTSTGKYTKIGNLVTVQINAVLSGAVSGGTGNVVITGMPFTAGTAAYGAFSSGRVTISGNNYFATIANGATSVTFSYLNSGALSTALPASDINGNTTPLINTTITYQV